MTALIRACLIAVMIMAGGGAAFAAYPDRPIRLVVPFPPGGPTDLVARTIAPKLSSLLAEKVTVDYVTGEDGITGTAVVAKAAPDGYTLLLTPSSFTIHPGTYSRLPFDSASAFTPVSLLVAGAYVLVVNASLPVDSVEELIAYAKSHSGRLSYAAAGKGGPTQLGFELFKIASGTDIAPVVFDGGKAAVDAVAAGKAEMMLAPLIAAQPLMKDDRLHALAVSSGERAAAFPDLPTIAETLPGFTAVSWYGVLAPAGTPDAIVKQLNAALDEIVHEPDVAKKFAAIGGEPVGGSPSVLADVIRAEIARWRQVAKEAGVRID
jgi:tripartite-type tricarboxylate transporter receptor subunit TctC